MSKVSVDSPEPPRVRHAAGPSRYEREVEERGETTHVEEVKAIGEWRLGRTVGKGASGKVKIAKSMRTGEYAAVKIIPKHVMVASASRMDTQYAREDHARAEKQKMTLEREIVIMKLIDHPNIIKLLDVHEKDGMIYLILEYVQGGELFEFLVASKSFPPDEASKYFQQIIRGLDYCHRFSICHRDLKPENIMLTGNKNIKIADFGMAAWENSGQLLETSCGSPHYASPEVVGGINYHGAASDIWSCGVILYALLAGALPFDHVDMKRLLAKVSIGSYEMPEGFPVDAKDLISRMLVVDPNKRIKMRDIMKHPFFLRHDPRKDEHSVPIVDPPDIRKLAGPLESGKHIDQEILKNLCALWKTNDDRPIIKALLSDRGCYEKVFYFLLDRHRRKRLENFQQPPEKILPRKIVRKPSVADVFSGHTRETSGGSIRAVPARERTRTNSAAHQMKTLHEEHRAAPPTPQRPKLNRGGPGHGTDPCFSSRVAPPSPTPVSPQIRSLRGPRPLALHAPAIIDGRTASSLMRQHPSGVESIQRPNSVPPPRLEFEAIDHSPRLSQGSVPPRPSSAMEHRSPYSYRHQAEPPRLPPIPQDSFLPTPETVAANLERSNVPIPSPTLPDDRYLNIFMQANPDGNKELDTYLREVAAQVAAFRQFGKPLSYPLSSPKLEAAHTSQPNSANDRYCILPPPTEERFFTPLMGTPALTGMDQETHAGREGLWDRSIDHLRELSQPTKDRRTSASTGYTVYEDASDGIETLDNVKEDIENEHARPAKHVRENSSSSNRRSVMGELFTSPNEKVPPRKRSRSALKGLELGSKKHVPAPIDTSLCHTPRLHHGGIEYIAPPLISPLTGPMDNDNKTSFFRGLRFNWKGMRKDFVVHDDPHIIVDECAKLLRAFRVAVDVENSEYLPCLKCKVDSFRATGIMFEKQLRFRVDIRPMTTDNSMSTSISNGTIGTTLITFVQERGSATVFTVVAERFLSEWSLGTIQSVEQV